MIKYKYIDGVPQFYPGCEHPLVEPVTPAEVLAYLQAGVESGTIKGAELTVVEKDGSYGRASMIDQSDAFFVDMDYEVATELPPGTYIVIGPVSDGSEG